MHEQFANRFYGSRAWKRCRKAYAESRGGLCERCLAKGQIVPGTEVHHKIRLTPATVDDPSIALNWSNLELLCDECHAAEHGAAEKPRWCVGPDGQVVDRGRLG